MFTELERATPRIIYRAINLTEDNAQTYAVSRLGGILNLTLTRIRQDFRKVRASISQLWGHLSAVGGHINIASFRGANQTLQGVTVRVFNEGDRHLLKHAFIWERNGSRTAFWREEIFGRPFRRGFPYGRVAYEWPIMRGTKAAGAEGLETLHSVRIEDIYARDSVYNDVQNYAADRYVVNTEARIDYEYSRLP